MQWQDCPDIHQHAAQQGGLHGHRQARRQPGRRPRQRQGPGRDRGHVQWLRQGARVCGGQQHGVQADQGRGGVSTLPSHQQEHHEQ